MKREFLQNFKVEGQPLPKEVIDAIMAENGKDIETAKKPYLDYDTVKQQLADAQTTIQGFKDQDIDGIRRSAQDWEKKYNDAIAAHQQELADRDFRQLLEGAITGAKGKNTKAITALLDVDTLKASKNQEADIKAALEGLQKEQAWMFDSSDVPPNFSPNAGTGGVGGGADGVTAAFTALNPGIKI